MLKKITLGLLALLFVGSGIGHFVKPEPYVAIMPPFLPAQQALVYISGAFEILGGVGLLIPSLRWWAGMGLVALLIAVFPANIYMAMYDVPLGEIDVPWWGHAIRLPLQGLMIAMVLWVSRHHRQNTDDHNPS